MRSPCWCWSAPVGAPAVSGSGELPGTAGCRTARSSKALSDAVRSAPDGVLGVLDRVLERRVRTLPLGLHVGQRRGEGILDLGVVRADRRAVDVLRRVAEDLPDRRVAEVRVRR